MIHRVPPELRELHDASLNAPFLLDRKTAQKIEDGEFRRAGGDVVCEECGKVLYDHPPVIGALWLIRTCEGELVKL